MADIYFSSTLMWNGSLDDIFRTAYENGFEGIELWVQHFMARGYSIEEYRKLKELYPVRTIVHNYSWDLNLASLNEGIREASVRETKKAIDFTDSLGGFEITVHPGKKTLDMETMAYYKKLKDSLMEIYSYAEERKIDISLEIMEKKYKEFIISKEAVEQLTEDMFDKLYYTLDVAHCEEEKTVFDTLDNLKRISKIHVSNKSDKRLHIPLSKGDYNFAELMPRLKEYRLPMVIEGLDLGNEFEILKENITFMKEIGGL